MAPVGADSLRLPDRTPGISRVAEDFPGLLRLAALGQYSNSPGKGQTRKRSPGIIREEDCMNAGCTERLERKLRFMPPSEGSYDLRLTSHEPTVLRASKNRIPPRQVLGNHTAANAA